MPKNIYADDAYSKLARQKGYRARSVFKLIEIQEKYQIVKKNDYILDLGSAPGSFMQYLSKVVGPNGFVLGIDLQAIKAFKERNIKTYQTDLLKLENPASLLSFLPQKKRYFDTIVADLAPKTTGRSEIDHARSLELNEKVLKIAKVILKPGGNYLTKIFQGEDFDDFIFEVKKYFKFTKLFKPKASRKESKEIFFIGKESSFDLQE